MKQMVAPKGDKGIKTDFITFILFSKPAGGEGDKGINTYGFIPYPFRRFAEVF